MTTPVSDALGGGMIVPISVYGEQIRVSARTRIFRTDLGVIILSGEIAVPRWPELVQHGLRWSPSLRHQIVETIYAAGRQATEILLKYGHTVREGEWRQLVEALEIATQLNVLAVTGNADGTDELRAKADRLVRPLLTTLGASRNTFKREALDRIVDAAKMTDALDRDNPTVVMAKAVASIRRLDRRIESLVGIAAVVAGRREALRRMREIAVNDIRIACDFLDRVIDLVPANITDEQSRAIAQRCRLIAVGLRRIDFRPFRSNTSRAIREMNFMARGFEDGRFQEAIERAITPRMSFRIKKLQYEIECLIFRCAVAIIRRQDVFPFEDAIRALKDIERRLSSIDETSFERKVCRRARYLVEEARKNLGEKRIAVLPDVKTLLKAASANL